MASTQISEKLKGKSFWCAIAQVLKPTAGNEPYSQKQLLIWCFDEENVV